MELNRFKSVRNNARKFWLSITKRKRYINDIVVDKYECDWQENYVPEDKHNSIFCSLAEWSSNITDLLYENSYDKYDFVTCRYKMCLFRYYTRFLLITSEILTDFQDAIIYLKPYTENHKQRARNDLTDNSLYFSSHELFEYINNVCKHKFGERGRASFKYHLCNNHINYIFKDDPNYISSPNRITINNLNTVNFQHGMDLEVPSLT